MPVKQDRTSQLFPSIGKVNGRSVLRWDPAAPCNDACPIMDDCPYSKKGRCTLEQMYMKNIFVNLINPDPNKGIGDQLNDVEQQRVGFHLIPLYHQLIKMKKEAYAVQHVSHVNKRGSIKIHPVFDEIRKIIRDIAKEIKDLDINGKWERKFGKAGAPMDLGTGVDVEELMEKGDPNFYSDISEE